MDIRLSDIQKVEVDLYRGVKFGVINYTEVNDNVLRELLEHESVLREWKMLMRALGLPERHITIVEHDKRGSGLKETVLSALLRWKETQSRVTLHDLDTALKSCDIRNIYLGVLPEEETELSFSDIERSVEFPCTKQSNGPHVVGKPGEPVTSKCGNQCLLDASQSQHFNFTVRIINQDEGH